MRTILLTVIGLKIIIIGLLIMFGGHGAMGEFLMRWWPVPIIILGTIPLINHPRKFAWPLFIMMIGVLLLLQQLQIFDAQLLQIALPSSLILLGILILISQVFQPRKENMKSYDTIRVFFGENETKNQSADYRGGSITAVGGAVSLDLRDATIKDMATLKVFALGSGIIIKIPENWIVKSRVSLNFGGVQDTHRARAKTGPTLTLMGDVVLGGVQIQRLSH